MAWKTGASDEDMNMSPSGIMWRWEVRSEV
jgi:hypothetical protein